ncbi:MAG: hypothetical protein RL226_124 [Bacteroidota bacterium]|jgi:hypothetical protein
MKKTVSALALTFLFINALVAQDDFNKFKMGFQVAPNVSWMQPQDKHFENEGAALRYSFGFMADIMFSKNYAFGTGMSVLVNGGKLSYLQSDRVDSTNVILRRTRDYANRYAEIPLTFKLRTNEIGYMTYWMQFGLGLGVNFRSRGDDTRDYLYEQATVGNEKVWKTTERPTVTEENTNFTDDINLFRLSLIIGAGVEYSLSGSTSLMAGVTFNNGFTNAMNKTNAVKTENGEPVFQSVGGDPETVKLQAISNSIQLNLGILF